MENLNTIESIETETKTETKKKPGPKEPTKYKNGGAFRDPNSPYYRPGCGKGNGLRKPKPPKEPKITITLKEYNELVVYKDRYNQMLNLLKTDN
jgi:hypothetical protein